MKVNGVALGFAAAVSVALGAGAWYVNNVYLPKAQEAKAQALQTEVVPQQEDPSQYDYTIPVDESAITARGGEERTPQNDDPAPAAPASGSEVVVEPSTRPGQDDEPTDVWITRDWHNGGESHVSTEPPIVEEKPTPEPPAQPTAPSRPTTSTPSTTPSTPSTQQPPAKPAPAPEPQSEPDPEPKPTGNEEPAAADEAQAPQRGETRVINGRTLVWYEGLGWVPESEAAATEEAPRPDDTEAPAEEPQN